MDRVSLRRRRSFAWVVISIAGIIAAALMLSSCGGSSPSNANQSAASQADILKATTTGSILTWDPRVTGGGECMFLANCYEPLVWSRYDESTGEQEFTPALATSWEHSSDGLEWVFHLREGVTFHDGTPFRADAVKYSVDSIVELGQGYAFLWADVKDVVVVDDYTVKFVLKTPIPFLPTVSSLYGAWIVSPKTAGKPTSWWDEGREAGTGPYMLTAYEPQQQVELAYYPDYWGGWKDNQFKKIVNLLIPEANTGLQMLQAGEVDFLGVIPNDQVESLKADSSLSVAEWRSVTSQVVFLNCAKSPFSNRLVRQALSYATPTSDILQASVNGLGTPSAGVIPTWLFPHNNNLKPYPYDLDKAKQLLAEAGYTGGGFSMELVYYPTNPWAENACTLIKQSFAKIGVDVRIRVQNYDTAIARARGNPQKAQDGWCGRWNPGFPHGYDSLHTTFGIENKGVWNISNWFNAEFDKLLDTAWHTETTNLPEAIKAYDKAQEIIYDEAPALFLWDDSRVTVCSSKINVDPEAVDPYYPSTTRFYYVTLK